MTKTQGPHYFSITAEPIDDDTMK